MAQVKRDCAVSPNDFQPVKLSRDGAAGMAVAAGLVAAGAFRVKTPAGDVVCAWLTASVAGEPGRPGEPVTPDCREWIRGRSAAPADKSEECRRNGGVR